MSSALSINGKTLLPIKEVVGRTRYTRDYIAKLAREGVIAGAQVGRQWFIDEESLQNFSALSELEADVRRRHLSRERRRERDLKVVASERVAKILERPRYSRARALCATALVLCCGLLSGFSFYYLPERVSLEALAVKAGFLVGELSRVALGTGDAMGETKAVPPIALPETVIETALSEQPVFVDTVEARRFHDQSTGVLVLPVGSSVSTTEEIAALFSDPVEVVFRSPGVGEITYRGAVEGELVSVPFLTVPAPVSERSENIP